MELRAVLFDLDNTLTHRGRSLEAFAPHFRSRFAAHLAPHVSTAQIGRVLVEIDATPTEGREIVYEELLRRLQWTSEPGFEAFRTDWRENFTCAARPMPHLEEMLHALARRGLRLGIVTNGGITSQHNKIDALGVRSFFETIVTGEDHDVYKPSTGIFTAALGNLGVASEDACHVGDDPATDVAGAQAAGLKAIWLRGFLPWESSLPAPYRTITSLRELPGIIA